MQTRCVTPAAMGGRAPRGRCRGAAPREMPGGMARGVMDRFVSHYTLRLDAKGRVSIPASFRAVLARDGFDGLYCYPALDRPALDAGGNALLQGDRGADRALSALFGGARAVLGGALFGTSEILKIDGEGRVILTEPLKIACRDHGRGRVRRPRPQVSDLGARTLPRGTRGGHREGPRAQEAARLPGSGGRSARSTGMMAGRGSGSCCRWRTGPSHSRARRPRRSSSSTSRDGGVYVDAHLRRRRLYARHPRGGRLPRHRHRPRPAARSRAAPIWSRRAAAG